jgi:hypothetical protein
VRLRVHLRAVSVMIHVHVIGMPSVYPRGRRRLGFRVPAAHAVIAVTNT